MGDLGAPVLLLGEIIAAFSIVLKAVDTLNGYRNLVLDIDEAGERLNTDQKGIVLDHNFRHLLSGLIAFLSIFTAFVLAVPLVVERTSLWLCIGSVVVAGFLLSTLYSVWRTAHVDGKRMERALGRRPRPNKKRKRR